MLMGKLVHGAKLTLTLACVTAAGWGIVGNSHAFGQLDDLFGNGETAATDPFSGDTMEDPFGGSGSPSSADVVDPFGVAPTEPTQPVRQTGRARGKTSVWERLKANGQWGIGSETDAEVRILEALAAKTRVEVLDEPLTNFLAILQERHGISVVIDHRALEDEGIDASSDLVSLDLENVSLQSALNLTLRQLDLTTVVRDEVLLVTSKSVAEETLTTRLYRIPDGWDVSEDELIATITTIVEPDSWDQVGGPGAMKGVRGGIFISNTHEVHQEVNKLFGQLDTLYGED